MAEKRKIPRGEEIDFEVEKEDWNKYKLADGTTIAIKLILTKVLKTEQYNPAGEPVYIFQSTNVVKTKVPSDLKKIGPQEEEDYP